MMANAHVCNNFLNLGQSNKCQTRGAVISTQALPSNFIDTHCTCYPTFGCAPLLFQFFQPPWKVIISIFASKTSHDMEREFLLLLLVITKQSKKIIL